MVDDNEPQGKGIPPAAADFGAGRQGPASTDQSAVAAQRILAGILANSEDAIISVGSDGCIRMFNRGARVIFGYKPHEVVGKPIEMLLPENLREGHRSHVTDFARGAVASRKISDQVEIIGLRKNGERFPAEATVSKVDTDDRMILTVILRDVSERRELEQRLLDMARYDSLTGLANRAMFHDLLEQSLARSRRNGNGIALLYLDLDRFKTINDTLGHRIGDLLLQEVAKRLKSCLRETDIVARLGGDEFTIVTEGRFSVLAEGVSARRNAAIIARKLIAELTRPFDLDGHEVFVSASVGIADCVDGKPDADALLKHADMAMYRAKDKGGATYEFHSPEMTEAANNRLELETMIRRGVEAGEFLLLYQPQIDLRDGRVVAVEALARWRRDGEHLVGPDEFIPVAEESGLIVPLGEWVLRVACAQLRHWFDAGLPAMRMTVNLSARQFQDRGLLDAVEKALDDAGIEPRLLELEITEGLLAENMADASETMAALKAIGVRLSIDDFGTGYSSLGYLKDCPVDTLKIDRCFVGGVGEEGRDAAIAATVIELAHNLDLEVIAEGVETERQRAWLEARGCDIVQGFLTGRPMAGDAFADWLASAGRPAPAHVAAT